jgi:hypothetical protein
MTRSIVHDRRRSINGSPIRTHTKRVTNPAGMRTPNACFRHERVRPERCGEPIARVSSCVRSRPVEHRRSVPGLRGAERLPRDAFDGPQSVTSARKDGATNGWAQ